jgi:AraC-like DNA-binding protein
MAAPETNFRRYLPTDQQAQQWGWRLIDAGRQRTLPGAVYPGAGHPVSYLFDREGRRTLDEFQLVFITSGSGLFESGSVPETTIRTGNALLLYPGEWHRYRPDPATGWTEYWIGFSGREARRIMETFFQMRSPILSVSHPDDLLRHFEQILEWLRRPGTSGREQILASHVPLALSLLKPGIAEPESLPGSGEQWVMLAKATMLEQMHSRVDLRQLAKDLGLSYSKFRFAFKEQTGYPPREYENRIKLNRARDLIAREGKSITETAAALGFSSVYYFSRAYKKRFGHPPSKWQEEPTPDSRLPSGA